MTAQPTTPSTESFAPPDLTGFLTGHDIMRTQYALLARAAGEVTARDSERIAALEDQLAFITRRLVWHHHHEDEHVFPRLRAVDQDLADLLDDLEQDHAQLDRLLAITGDVATPFGRRAPAIRDLHRSLAAHLEREEAQAVPAIRRIIPASAWALEDVRFQDELGADRTTTLTWLLGHLAGPARDGLLATLPPPVQELYRTEWRPAYLRQVALMYGAEGVRTATD
jgi:hypothetical protein